MAKVCKLPISVGKLARAANMTIEETIGGRIKIIDRATRAKVAIVSTEEEARKAINKFVGQNMADLDGGLTVAGRGTALSQGPPKFQDQLTKTRSLVSLFQIAPGARFFTPIEKFMQATERLGIGPAFAKIYNPTQAARGAINIDLSHTKRGGLAGMFGRKQNTYETATKALEKRVLDLDPEQRRLVTLHQEAFTKEELARPGVFLEEGMTVADINAADALTKLGMADDLPIIIRRNALIDDFLDNKDKFVQNIRQMENMILEGRLPEEFAGEIQRLRGMVGDEQTVDDVIRLMGLTDDERAGVLFVRKILANEEEIVYNIPAIYRYATAPNLKKGFKDGRAQFAAERGMLPEAVELSNARWRILEDGFADTGFSVEQVLGAQLPVFRQFISAGIMPGKQFAQSKGAVRKWAGMLEGLPEGSDMLTRRVLSGHLNPHELDPAVTAYKHLRNLSMRKHLDPIIEEVLDVADIINAADPRVGRITYNYIHEIQGLPTESFKQLTGMIRTVYRLMGMKVDDRIAERLVSTLTFMSYSASIPFRAALVARNFFQTSLAIPIIGPEAWSHGIKSALGWDGRGFSMELAQEVMERTIKGGGLKVNIVPLHGGVEALSGVEGQMFANLRPVFAKAQYNVKELFTMGFTAYRKGDDFGRVVAFEAGRFRVNKHLGAYIRSNRDDAALEAFKRNAKVKTFDEAIEAEFETLIRNDMFPEAENLIGRKLADKVHFLYGDANHPPGWGGVGGKLFGQFGTFPVQYANHLLESMTRGTVKDRAEFIAMHGAVNLGIIAAGVQMGVDLDNWAFLPSLQYTGGPYAEVVFSTVSAIGGSDAEQALARRNLQMMFPSWNRPSIFVPGSYFISDISRGFQEDTFTQGLIRATGIRLIGDKDANIPGLARVTAGFGWVNEIAREPR